MIDGETRAVDYADGTITENTRACYPIEYIPNAHISPVWVGTQRILFSLPANAFGVLPPVSKLTAEQAMYHFMDIPR